MNKQIKQIGKNALEIIKQKKINPRSKWKCLLYSRIAWALSFVFIIIGSLAFSVVIYMTKNNDWDLYIHLGDSLIEFIIVTLPYFWIVLLVILAYLALFSSKFTKEGYKYKLVILLSFGLFINIVLGGLFYSIGLGQVIDLRLQEKVPVYNYLSVNKEKMWTQPKKGILSGVIVSKNDNKLIIKDYLDNLWITELSNNAIVSGRIKLDVGYKIKIIGEKIDDNEFLAEKIRPWIGRNFGNKKGTQGY